MLKLPDGHWSGPSALKVQGGGIGLQLGLSHSNSLIIINTDEGVENFKNSTFQFGGKLSVAMGPLGRNASANLHVGAKSFTGALTIDPYLLYTESKGVYLGGALGAVRLVPNQPVNDRYYDTSVDSVAVLEGKIPPPSNEHYDSIVAMLQGLTVPTQALNTMIIHNNESAGDIKMVAVDNNKNKDKNTTSYCIDKYSGTIDDATYPCLDDEKNITGSIQTATDTAVQIGSDLDDRKN